MLKILQGEIQDRGKSAQKETVLIAFFLLPSQKLTGQILFHFFSRENYDSINLTYFFLKKGEVYG